MPGQKVLYEKWKRAAWYIAAYIHIFLKYEHTGPKAIAQQMRK